MEGVTWAAQRIPMTIFSVFYTGYVSKMKFEKIMSIEWHGVIYSFRSMHYARGEAVTGVVALSKISEW
jgi:hypothetical protein